MSKPDNYTQQLDETIQKFSAEFEAILAVIVREAVARVVTNVAITQRWAKKEGSIAPAVLGLAPVRRGRPKGSKNKPKGTVVPHCSTSGCEKPITAKGLCGTHYRRNWREAKRAGTANGNATAVAS